MNSAAARFVLDGVEDANVSRHEQPARETVRLAVLLRFYETIGDLRGAAGNSVGSRAS